MLLMACRGNRGHQSVLQHKDQSLGIEYGKVTLVLVLQLKPELKLCSAGFLQFRTQEFTLPFRPGLPIKLPESASSAAAPNAYSAGTACPLALVCCGY